KRLAALNLPQLSAYNLDNLLDQQPDNEARLVATGEVWQIAAFAELYEQQTRNSQQLQRTASHYARAARLHRAIINISGDSSFVLRLGDLYLHWAGDILESSRPDTAQRYIELECRLGTDKSACPELWQHFSEKTGKRFDFQRFMASGDVGELRGYGDFFFKKEKWLEARQLYEKAEGKQHSAEVLQNLFTLSEKMGGGFDFQRFMASGDVGELRGYGDFFCDRRRDTRQAHVPDLLFALRLQDRVVALDSSTAARDRLATILIELTYYQLYLPDGPSVAATLGRLEALRPDDPFLPLFRPFVLLAQGQPAEAVFRAYRAQPMPGGRWSTYGEGYRWVLKNLEGSSVPGINYAEVRGWLE
ncbi:MAG TPA: hypothetical protein PK971_17015, partial [Saprospiraceae bacterium]|nr:hypothetical protein [Saprospiraceae bacterium]